MVGWRTPGALLLIDPDMVRKRLIYSSAATLDRATGAQICDTNGTWLDHLPKTLKRSDITPPFSSAYLTSNTTSSATHDHIEALDRSAVGGGSGKSDLQAMPDRSDHYRLRRKVDNCVITLAPPGKWRT